MHSVEAANIPGPVTGIQVRTYRPSAGPAPTVVYFHGGGWMTGSIDSHDFLVRKLARELGLAFVSVDYRLAREHPYPGRPRRLPRCDRCSPNTSTTTVGSPAALGGR
jgi:acetyl esterase/lipase